MSERFDVVFYSPWAASLAQRPGGERVAGGGEVQQFLLARSLAARGLRVAMIVMGDPEEMPSEVDGVRMLTQAPRRRLTGALARAALALGALRSLASARTEVLIQRNAGPTTALVALAARIRGARFVYSSASVVDFEFADHQPGTLNVAMFQWGVRRASTIVVQTDEQARLCRARFGREPIVIRSIADRPPSARTQTPEAFLWVGKLQAVKAPDRYLELARAVPESRFWMIAVPDAGEPPEVRARVEEAVAALPNLELLDPRSRAGVGELLERTVAVVNTSVREGMPNVFLEGWSRGVPALAFSFDPDGVVRRARLGDFAGGDPALFAEHARAMWRARHDQRELADRCTAYMRSVHDAEAVVERWVEAIRPG
jgi:hypothetical protein